MATSKEKADEFLKRREKNFDKAGDVLWQHVLANAVIGLLEQSKDITAQSLITELESNSELSGIIGEKALEATIHRLRKFVP